MICKAIVLKGKVLFVIFLAFVSVCTAKINLMDHFSDISNMSVVICWHTSVEGTYIETCSLSDFIFQPCLKSRTLCLFS